MGFLEKYLLICGVCGCTIQGQYKKIHTADSRQRLLYNLCLDCDEKFRMITQDKVPYPSNIEETKLILERGTVETRMRCNVCGEVFCYSVRDLVRSRELKKEVSDTRKMAAMEALFGTRLAANQHTEIADNLGTQIVDYSKCPKCNSTDLTEIGEEEFKAITGFPANNNTAPCLVADEIKKFKELLDSGIITQEEFDAKKKQLLGL